MLATIPPEIISYIALHLCLASPLPALPIPLLQSCRTINDAISPQTNPRLYARVFRSFFDTAAPERRFGQEVVRQGRGKWDEGRGEAKLRAQELMEELRKRVGVLSRLRGMVERQDVADVTDDDFWVLYFMLVENDGKNTDLLLGPNAVVHLPTFLDLYHQQHLLAAAVEPGYPAETVGRSLAMWIAWLVGGSGSEDETSEQREERMFVLRPYVFAAPRYDAYFAPWTLPDLPLLTSPPPQPENNPFIANLQPHSRLVTLRNYGREVRLCPPFIAQAAILRFFYRGVGEELDEAKDGGEVVSPFMALNIGAGGGAGGGAGSASLTPTGGTGTVTPQLGGDVGPAIGTGASTPSEFPPLPTFSSGPHLLASSTLHDRDFTRLSLCYDPLSTPGMHRAAWKGCWDGCWEGTFSFFDFDAFREMLAGHARALYEGPYGEQAQVWRLKETWVRRKGWVRPVKEETVVDRKGKGKARDQAGDEEDSDEEMLEAEVSPKPKGLPLSGPMINAGFPTDHPTPPFTNLASAAAEAATLEETIRQQVEAIEGYEMVPPEDLDEMLAEEDGGEAAGLDMLLTGTGHSAWGKFVLKGRVRAWDGMASLVKEYAPDSRGKWIYRGYVLAGDIFVGRWRDTFTPEAYVGYEGTFTLNRR
ncbi:hypothetical protein IAT38_006016 [Cryptococcus sp. DSM 104549]